MIIALTLAIVDLPARNQQTSRTRNPLVQNQTEWSCGLTARKEVISAVQNKSTAVMYRRIGSTTYKVNVHFSETGAESMEEKTLRMIENESVTSDSGCGMMDVPQMSCQSGRSA